jgi:hypothetical protein
MNIVVVIVAAAAAAAAPYDTTIAWNKSSLLLKILKLNTQTLQLFTLIIKSRKYIQK